MAHTVTATTVNSVPVIVASDDLGGISVVINYSSYFERIATALETLTALGQGDGIKMVSPYEALGNISLYKTLIDQGKILSTTGEISGADQARAKAKIPEYIDNLNKLVGL